MAARSRSSTTAAGLAAFRRAVMASARRVELAPAERALLPLLQLGDAHPLPVVVGGVAEPFRHLVAVLDARPVLAPVVDGVQDLEVAGVFVGVVRILRRNHLLVQLLAGPDPRFHHPDRAIARGLPEEFVAIASTRVAALNAAYEAIEKGRRRR